MALFRSFDVRSTFAHQILLIPWLIFPTLLSLHESSSGVEALAAVEVEGSALPAFSPSLQPWLQAWLVLYF
jgi:hypothetical protein